MPARMVGQILCSARKRKPGRDAGNVYKRAVGGSHGGLPPTSFVLVLSVGVWLTLGAPGRTAAGQSDGTGKLIPPPAIAAGRNVAPGVARGTPQRSLPRYQPPEERPPTPEVLAAARGMEQLLLDLMVSEMRKTVPENDVVPLSQGERIFRQMLDQEYTRAMVEAGGVGVADLVLAQMRGKR